uniref:Retroviral polymerase SH3-like domain-containing protein n=1 Tax=Tanacetum cinerariifolium TaxID=118510 RepID=A0A699GSI6_TANCI|nr:hypothetical protein [Tanacetum cinerariifolium]
MNLKGNPQQALKDKGVIDSCCSRHMNGNISYLSDFEEINGGYVAFSRNPKGGKITGKGKFDGKANEGFLVRYSVSSKAFRVINSRTRIVQETLHINFLENQPNVTGSSPTWLFDIDTLIQSMNYQPVVTRNQPNHNVGIQENLDVDANAAFDVKEPEYKVHASPSSSDKTKKHDEKTKKEAKGKSPVDFSTRVRNLSDEFKDFSFNSTNRVNAASYCYMPTLEDIIYSDDEEDVGAEADFSNLETKPDYPDKVYKVVKALYGHQAPKAWYETLANYLLENDFKRGKIDQTLFIKKQKGNILLVQKEDGIFISQDKYVAEILRKFGLTYGKSASSFINTKKPLLKDPDGEDVDVHIIVSIKKSNDAVKLQALIDQKKVIITKDTIRQNLRLDDADGIDCLLNEEIFAELAWMGYEKPGLSGMNLVLPWPRLSSALQQGFLGVETPLFDAMLVPQQVQAAVAEVKEDEDNKVSAAPTTPSPTPATTPPPPPQEHIPSPSQAHSAQPISPPQ